MTLPTRVRLMGLLSAIAVAVTVVGAQPPAPTTNTPSASSAATTSTNSAEAVITGASIAASPVDLPEAAGIEPWHRGIRTGEFAVDFGLTLKPAEKLDFRFRVPAR